MPVEFAIREPTVASPGLNAIVRQDNDDFSQKTEIIGRATDIINAVKLVVPVACAFEENKGRTGISFAITRPPVGFPIYTVQFGEITQPDPKYRLGGKAEKYTDLAADKTFLLQIRPKFIASSQNTNQRLTRRMRSSWGLEIPGGGLRINGWLLACSGFPDPHMDEAVVLAGAFGARLMGKDQIEDIAMDHRVGCRTFFKHEDQFLKPFLG